MLAELPRPVVVMSIPRSGSSMTAGCLALHGFWLGRCFDADQWNAKGYFENAGVNTLHYKYGGPAVSTGRHVRPDPRFAEEVRELMRAEGYWGGPWLVKHSAIYWRHYIPFNPVWVCVYRDMEACWRSQQRSMKRVSVYALWRHFEELDELCRLGGHRVDAERLWDGDFSQLAPPLEAVGKTLDEYKCRAFIDAGLRTQT